MASPPLKWMSRLGPRLWMLIVLFGAVLTLLSTAIQLLVEYRRDVADIDELLHQVALSNAPSLARSVWSFNERQLRAELQGITALPDVARVELVTGYGDIYTEGTDASGRSGPRQIFDLTHASRTGPVQVGRVTVFATLENVYSRLWGRALIILGVQAAKTFLVSLLALFLFHRVVTRHLGTMASYARRMKVSGLDEPLRLNRLAGRSRGDELDEVVLSINELRSNLQCELSERRRAAASSAYLAQVSVHLGESLDLDAVTDCICRTALEHLGEIVACSVSADGAALWCDQAVPEFGASSEREGLSTQLRRLFEERAGTAILEDVRRPVLVSATATSGEHAAVPSERQLLMTLQCYEYSIAPLWSRGRRLGAVLLLRTQSGATSHAKLSDPALLEEFARRAAMAVDNALLYRKVQEAIRMREEFLSVASHELKTPLTALQLQIQLALRTVQDSARAPSPLVDLSRRLELIRRQGDRLRDLINELLDVSQIVGRRHTPIRQRVALRSLVSDVLERTSEQARAAGCRLVLDAPAEVEGLWDPSQIEQVVTNLLGNAMKFGAGAPIEVEVAAQPGDRVRLTVRDHGIGIPEEQQTRIFERFARGVSARNFGGLGLGLYIVREVVLAHGGQISVESAPGHGARIVVDLPTRNAPAQTAPSAVIGLGAGALPDA